MVSRNLILAFFLGFITFSAAVDPSCKNSTATFKVIFQNLLSSGNFGDLIPEAGLIFAPIIGVSHSNRLSFLTVRGFPSRAVRLIAETGDISMLSRRARTLRRRDGTVKSVENATAVMPGDAGHVLLDVDCERPFVTVLSMIAPSPDWFVQISNRNLYDSESKDFIKTSSGNLIAYDAGSDDGGDFTDPADLSLDIETIPRKNIAPLVEDETDRFEGRYVGTYAIVRLL